MRIPDPKANTTTEAYLAYKAGYLEESELKPKLYEPYLHFDAWLAYWAGLTNTYPLDKNGDPEMLTDEEALVAYLSGVTDTYPEEIKDPYDVRIVGYLKHLASIRWSEPDYPVNNEEFYLSTMEPTHTSNSVPSSDIELDTAEGKIIDVEAYGDTTQTTYSGKNLWNGEFGQGVTYNPSTANRITSTQSPLLKNGETYTVSLSSVPTGIRYAVALYNNPAYPGSSPGAAVFDSSWKTSTSFTFTAEGDYYFSVVMSKTDNSEITPSDVSNVNFQLEKSSSASPYEPFVGGTPAPNPSYPQPISVVTGENVVKVVGKNLFDTDTAVTRFEAYNGSVINGWGTYSDGVVTIVKSNGAHGTCAFAGFKPTLIEGETYTLSATIRLSGTNATNQIRFGVVQNSPNMAVSGKDVWLEVSKTFVATATDVSDSRVDIQAANTGNIIEIKNIQLELGSQATSYQAYTAQDYAISLRGKNLFNKATSTDGYRIDSNGDPYANASYFISDYIAVQPSTTYAYSRGAAGSGLATIAYYKSDKTFISRTMPTIGSSDTSGTVTTPNNAYYARFCDVNEVLDSAQLELGSTATEYAAYSPIELAKIGTYQDRIYKEGEKWYVEKQVGKVVLDGSETWASATFTNNPNYTLFQTREYDTTIGGTTTFDSMSDYFIQSPTVVYASMPAFDGAIVSIGSGGNYKTRFGVPNSIATDTTVWATWLASHPTTVYYALATPTTTEITDQTLIDQLEALASATLNQGVNNIFTEIATGNAMPTLELNWVEWEKYNRHNVYIWNDDIDDWQVIVS